MRHGSVAGYSAWCRCDDCTAAATRYKKKWNLDRARGIHYEVDATGTARRLQALAVMGWTARHIGDRIGASRQHVQNLMSDRDRVRTTTARQIEAVYRELARTPGPSAVGRSRALAKGWASPAAWDDIDNDTAPNLGSTVKQMGPARQVHVEDIEDAISWGYDTYPSVAHRLGVTVDAIQQSLHRHGRNDLRAKLRKDNAA